MKNYISSVLFALLAVVATGGLSMASQYVPPGGALPSESACAAGILSDAWAPRPENAPFNTATPSAAQLASFHASPLNFSDGPPPSDFSTVDGNFSGTTWQLIQWAACKWGVDATDLAAQAWLESSWTQSTVGDQQWTYAACIGGPWIGWESAWGGCWTSYGIAQAKAVSFNVMPMAQSSTAFNLDFRAAYWRACMNGDVAYLYDETPSPGYPTYANAGASDRYWGCAGEWGSGGWEDSYSTYYQQVMQGFSATRPWLNIPNSGVGQIALYAPQRGQTVSGTAVQISFVSPANDPMACYVCVSVDRQRIAPYYGAQDCGPPQTYWWDSTAAGMNGMHEIAVDTFSCPANGQDAQGWHAGIEVMVAN